MTDAEILEAALIGLQRQRSELDEKVAELRWRVDGSGGGPARKSVGVDSVVAPAKKRTLSASARRRIAAAQRKRWAELKKTQAPKPASARKKRRISAAGMKRIIAATKKRWAEFHARKAAAK